MDKIKNIKKKSGFAFKKRYENELLAIFLRNN